jgi:iron complex transport system ATP-binding protein
MTNLAATAVTASYGPRVVLRECSFAIGSGEIVAVVGPNGAGKSTLLRVLAGLLRPAAGTVALDGQDLRTFSRAEVARRIAVVPQIFDTLFPFTVREVVALGRTARLGALGRASADDVAAVDRAIDELELGPLASRRIDRLSGGERQRAVLAMALAQETPVLLLDEPTVHLDPGHQLATLELLHDLGTRRRLAVCAVLHDLNLASAFASRIVAIADGRIVREGTPLEVIHPDLVKAVFGDGLEVVARDGHPAVLPRLSQEPQSRLR